MRHGPVDFVIVTALKVERNAVLGRLPHVETLQEEGDPHTYYYAQLDIPGIGPYSLIVTMLLKPGNYSAAASTTRLIQRWQPRYVLVIGIAGGVAGRVALGDVVVADYCYAYELSKRKPGGDEGRGQQFPTDQLLYGRAQAYEDRRWQETIGVARPASSFNGEPAAHFGPIASGEKLFADPKSLPQLIEQVPKLLATEMEAAGVANALHQAGQAPGFFEIRGISDFADDQKNDDWHAYAANAAAAFTIGFLQTGPVEPVNPEFGPGRHIGRYEIMRELGRGGVGTVWLAHDPSMDRQVAIKVLPRQFTHDPQFRVRFRQEAQIIAALEHPCIVPVYDYGEQDDQPYLVMRYMVGGTLTARLAQGRLALEQIVAIVQRLAEALDAAHQEGIIHRDVKPGNVLFGTRGNAALSDFGLAKLLTLSPAVSDSNVTTGTPTYMSPEQAQGEKGIDRRTDVYSLGAMLYEMLVGRPPYEAKTATAMMLKHITEPVPSIDTALLGLPAGCNAVILRAMAKTPDERYGTAGELAQAVSALWQAANGPDLSRQQADDLPSPIAPVQASRPALSSKVTTTSQFIRDWVARSPEQPPLVHGSIGLLRQVAAGPFIMGSSYHVREAPPRTVYLPDFEIGHVPVTISQYVAFLDSGGYQQERWWSEAGWAWRRGSVKLWGRADASQPDDWANQGARPSYPVTGVTWYEAQAYCSWLAAQKNRNVRLPTEEEWEKAARGTDGRLWPWGDAFHAKSANTYEYGALDTLPVEHVEGDVSAYGLRDMGGNVQDWTSSPYRPLPDEEFPDSELRVARGGSWNDTAFGARASFRHAYPPGYFFPFLGFRIVMERL